MSDKMIRVRATQLGNYQGRKHPGTTFDIPEQLFSDKWMEKMEQPKAEGGNKGRKSQQPKAEGGE